MRCALWSLALLPLCAGSLKTTWRDLDASGYSFADYVEEYAKVYPSEEHAAAREADFERNLMKIRKHNSEGHSWKMGLNRFTDVDTDSKAVMKEFTGNAARDLRAFGAREVSASDLVGDVPESVDWRTKGAVTAVKNQGGCGSCWAFAATETLESHVFLKAGKLLELSPQQIVSCAPNPQQCGGTGGCEGSTAELAFNYTITAGTSLDTSYPYTHTSAECDAKKIAPVATIAGWTKLKSNDHDTLLKAIATLGPIAVSVDACWGRYEEGVFTDPSDGSCTTIDHAVQAVGYGTDKKGGDYWIVRNSWGGSWGEHGYIRMKRYGAGHEKCGMDEHPGDGTACKGQTDPVKVCGTSGILYDSSFPTGAKLV